MNRRWRDHVPVAELDHLAGADQLRIGLLHASGRDTVIGEGLDAGELLVMTAPGTAGGTGR
jgi:hypothetical protein